MTRESKALITMLGTPQQQLAVIRPYYALSCYPMLLDFDSIRCMIQTDIRRLHAITHHDQ